MTQPIYNEANLLEAMNVSVRGGSTTPVITNLDYNAKGQRVLCEYANGTTTKYSYDEKTFRLTQLETTRASDSRVLQDLRYTYDPVGNIVELQDRANWQHLFKSQPVSGDGKYVYDALYRLISAEGREHPGQQPTSDDPARGSIPHPNDLQALKRYDEHYKYDEVGNIKSITHHANGSGWTRNYQYAYQVTGEPAGNKLLRTSGPGDPEGTLSCAYTHNAHGSMTSMPHLSAIAWDYGERMQHANKGGGGDVYFTYDGAGQRVRKVYEHSGIVEERIYLGGYELYRKRAVGSASLDLERETLHLMDDRRRVGMVETKTVDVDDGITLGTRWRYQLDNHLGSSSLELDQEGSVISYEEYHPFGSTAFHVADGNAEVSAKRYRYTGKEKDDETGLYYHGARYYAPWLGRWTAVDPVAGDSSGNRYCYVGNQPISAFDPDGRKRLLGTVLDVAKGVGQGLQDLGKGLATMVAHPVDTLSAVGAQMKKASDEAGGGASGAMAGFNVINPAYHTMVAAFETYQAIQRGDAKEAGKQGFNVVLQAASTGLLATGVGSAVNGVATGTSFGTKVVSLLPERVVMGSGGTAALAPAVELIVPTVHITAKALSKLGTGTATAATGMAMSVAGQGGGEPPGEKPAEATSSGESSSGTKSQIGEPEVQQGVTAEGGNGRAGRVQEHHVMTNKNLVSTASGGPWTPRFADMAKRAGMTLKDAANRVRIPGHRGPHPEAYHTEVFNRLSRATEGLSGDAYSTAFRAELDAIRIEAKTAGSALNRLLAP